MNVFTLLGLSFLGVLSVLTVWAGMQRQLSRWAAGLWLMVWLAAAIAIAAPGLTMVIAEALGIGRGADLVFYCAILAMLAGFFHVFGKLRRIEQNLTRLVRHLAIEEAAEPPEASGQAVRADDSDSSIQAPRADSPPR